MKNFQYKKATARSLAFSVILNTPSYLLATGAMLLFFGTIFPQIGLMLPIAGLSCVLVGSLFFGQKRKKSGQHNLYSLLGCLGQFKLMSLGIVLGAVLLNPAIIIGSVVAGLALRNFTPSIYNGLESGLGLCFGISKQASKAIQTLRFVDESGQPIPKKEVIKNIGHFFIVKGPKKVLKHPGKVAATSLGAAAAYSALQNYQVYFSTPQRNLLIANLWYQAFNIPGKVMSSIPLPVSFIPGYFLQSLGLFGYYQGPLLVLGAGAIGGYFLWDPIKNVSKKVGQKIKEDLSQAYDAPSIKTGRFYMKKGFCWAGEQFQPKHPIGGALDLKGVPMGRVLSTLVPDKSLLQTGLFNLSHFFRSIGTLLYPNPPSPSQPAKKIIHSSVSIDKRQGYFNCYQFQTKNSQGKGTGPMTMVIPLKTQQKKTLSMNTK